MDHMQDEFWRGSADHLQGFTRLIVRVRKKVQQWEIVNLVSPVQALKREHVDGRRTCPGKSFHVAPRRGRVHNYRQLRESCGKGLRGGAQTVRARWYRLRGKGGVNASQLLGPRQKAPKSCGQPTRVKWWCSGCTPVLS